MSCNTFREQVQEYLDLQMNAKELSCMDSHRRECRDCASLYEEYAYLQQLIGGRLVLSDAVSRRILDNVRRKGSYSFRDAVVSGWDRFRTYLRDLEPMKVWSKASAVPITLCFFAMLLQHLTPVNLEHLAFLIISSGTSNSETVTPMVLNIQVRQNPRELRSLMDTAWRLPYEDSLSLVAQITPEGHAEIDDVLDYPKSYALLDAVDLTLRSSSFSASEKMENPFVILYFQKIDVYEDS